MKIKNKSIRSAVSSKIVQKRDVRKIFCLFVAVGSFTADSSLLQPTGGVNSTHLTRHMFSLVHICLHAFALLKS